MRSERADLVATSTLASAAVACLLASYFMPWWVMRARAPQYGQRTLVVEVGPRGFGGDVKELDVLGHYVGIRPLGEMAKLERAAAPYALALAVAALLALAFLERRWARLLAALPTLLAPVAFMLVLDVWVDRSLGERDEEAALGAVIGDVDAKLFGEYAVGQFEVSTAAGEGFHFALLSGALALGLAFSRPWRPWGSPRRAAAAVTVALMVTAFPANAEGPGSVGEPEGPAKAPEVRIVTGSLQEAIRQSREGDVLELPGRVFRERIVLDKALTLRGRPGTVIDGGGEGTVIRITASRARLEGLVVRGSGDNYTSEDAAIRLEAPEVVLKGLRIEDALFGIFALRAHRCVVEESQIAGKALPVPRRGDGIRLWSSDGCRLSRNLVENSRDIVVWYSANTLAEDNVVRGSRYGLHYMYSNDNAFRRNRFEHNEVGAAVMYSKGVTLEDNHFSFSNGPAAYGLLLKDSDDVFVVGNRFEANSGGLFFDGAPQSKGARVDVHRNLVARNDVAVVLQPSSRGIRFWENAFIGNRVQVQVQGESMAADGNVWSVSGRGNYWSDGIVYDADGDGISELPYRAESTYEALLDRHPELAFWADSPAAAAIDTAARLFPVFAPRPRMVDPHPLTRPPPRAPGSASMPLAVAGAAMLSLSALAALRVRRSP